MDNLVYLQSMLLNLSAVHFYKSKIKDYFKFIFFQLVLFFQKEDN
jgi:hypothetical protein